MGNVPRSFLVNLPREMAGCVKKAHGGERMHAIWVSVALCRMAEQCYGSGRATNMMRLPAGAK